MKWCDKCACAVRGIHKHWGRVDYYQDAAGQWFCTRCRTVVRNNKVECTCK
jgi:hypothetical protein